MSEIWAVGGVQVVDAGAEGLPRRESKTVSRVEDLTNMAHMEGSNPLAPTKVFQKTLGNSIVGGRPWSALVGRFRAQIVMLTLC